MAALRRCEPHAGGDSPGCIDAYVSSDGGRSWSCPVGLRANAFHHDTGYPQMVVNQSGELVVYYLATTERPHSFIEATVLRP